MEIAGKLTDKDWKELEICLDITKQENWGTAFNFFEQRITTRYLNPIKAILDMGLNTGEGFSVVNLQCSLIETIECFYEGWIYNYPDYVKIGSGQKLKGSKKIFESFFNNRAPFNNLGIKGSCFYENVRCGLLHETQTKRGWKIKSGKAKIYTSNNTEKIIFREGFQKGIESVISEYKTEIIENSNEKLRNYFLSKLNHICSQS